MNINVQAERFNLADIGTRLNLTVAANCNVFDIEGLVKDLFTRFMGCEKASVSLKHINGGSIEIPISKSGQLLTTQQQFLRSLCTWLDGNYALSAEYTDRNGMTCRYR